MLYENIKRISREKKIPVEKIEEVAQITKGSLCKWRDSKPSYDKVIAVADLLEVSIDELAR